MPLFHQWAHLAWQVSFVVNSVHVWVRALMPYPFKQSTEHFPAVRELPSRKETFRSAPASFLSVLQPGYVVSSAIRLYHLLLVDNKRNGNSLY